MERTEEALRKRVRETPLSERLTTCEKYIASMCAERRPPKMTIPLQHYDEDFYIYTTLADAQATIAALQKEIATRDSTDSILATRIRELEARLTQRTAELEALRPLYDDMWKQFAESQAELERVRGELAETKEEVKRCGTCRWWKIHDGQENRIDCATGDCTYPLPICLPDEYRITPYSKAGKDCPTWHAK